MTEKKRYQVRGECPNCACGTISHLTAEEIQAKTIESGEMELKCPECMEVHRAQIRSACPDYADDCHM